MGLNKTSWLTDFLCWVVLLILCCFGDPINGSEISVDFTEAPAAFSHLNFAIFKFEVLVGGKNNTCRNCSTSCKLDDKIISNCARKVSATELQDGNHILEVCINGSGGVGCGSYNWTVDTVAPTAEITASESFTSSTNVSVEITFSEPCTGGGGFSCSSVNACNVLVYGAGQVIPSTLKTLQPNFKYSLLVDLSSSVLYGRVIIIMDRNFCSDRAGNRFTRTDSSSLFVHFDRRSVFVNLKPRIPEKLLQVNGATRTVQATNDHERLKVFLHFSEPILNSSVEVLNSLRTNEGSLRSTSLKSLGNRRYGFVVESLPSIAVVTVSLDSNSLKTRQGTTVSPIAPVTFLYDSQRPAVMLITTSNKRTRERNIPVLIQFMKPVLGFNISHISILGGHLHRFSEVSTRLYSAEIQAEYDVVSVSVPENVTSDIAGNKNLASNVLQVMHYSVPVISSVLSIFVTTCAVWTSFAAGLLTVSSAVLQSVGAFSSSHSFFLTADPSRNLFRLMCHVQVFALTRWIAVTLPVEYYELARGLQWTIPYIRLPWELPRSHPIMMESRSPAFSGSSSVKSCGLGIPDCTGQKNLGIRASVYDLPLTPMEYRQFFEGNSIIPEATKIMEKSKGWTDFSRMMFWLTIISGGLMLLHMLLLLILKCKKKNSENQSGYGALTFPRFEIYLIILALPCLSEASAALIQGEGASRLAVGILLLGAVSVLILVMFLFISFGITFGKLLNYKEVHQEGLKFHWYQELVRVTLGPGKRGQWTWKNQPNSVQVTMFGPLFENLRGPPKYMLSQISGGSTSMHGDQIIASDDETEDAEAPVIQKVFGILRIYYTVIDSVKRVCLGIVAGMHLHTGTSKTPTIALLSITSFQLFFLVLKKPFIKKRVQLVEIISVASELAIFATCWVLLQKEFSAGDETKVGIFMLSLFLVSFLAQMGNELFALYRQTQQLDPIQNSFFSGLKTASIGLLLLFIPQKMVKDMESRFPLDRQEGGPGSGVPSGEKCRISGTKSSGSSDRAWMKQLRELAKASFSKEGRGSSGGDPSSSHTGWSGFDSASKKSWNTKSGNSEAISNSKSKVLRKDLEAIFASK